MITSTDRTPRNVLAVLEGYPESLGTGIFAQGGFFDNALDKIPFLRFIVRGDLGYAITHVLSMWEANDPIDPKPDRSVLNAVFYSYCKGVQKKLFSIFSVGNSDVDKQATVHFINSETGVSTDIIYQSLVLLERSSMSGEDGSPAILAGDVGLLATLANDSPLATLAKALGIPPEVLTFLLVTVGVVGGVYVIKNIKEITGSKKS